MAEAEQLQVTLARAQDVIDDRLKAALWFLALGPNVTAREMLEGPLGDLKKGAMSEHMRAYPVLVGSF